MATSLPDRPVVAVVGWWGRLDRDWQSVVVAAVVVVAVVAVDAGVFW